MRDNAKGGLMIGSPFFPTVVLGATVTGNVVVDNGMADLGNVGIGRAVRVTVRQNRFVAGDRRALSSFGMPYRYVALDRNCYDDPEHDSSTAIFSYASATYTGFSSYRRATGQDRHSQFGASCRR